MADPKDPDKIPIGPGDCVESMHRAASRYPIVVGFTFGFLDFIIQAHKHGPQQIVGHVHAVGHALADFAGFFEQPFSFGFFHNSTVFGGPSNKNVQGLQA